MSAYFKENGKLIEIPFGTQGPQGPQGPKGDKGDPGEGGSSIAKDISYDNAISGIPAENVQDVIDVLSKGDDKGGSSNYILHIDPSSSSIVDDCMIHVQQLFNGIVIDEFNGTLTEIGAQYFRGFDDAGKWHDLAFNGATGSYLTIYANKDGLVYNGNTYNTGNAIHEFYRGNSFDGTFTNGSHVAIITDGSDYISYGNKTVKKELDNVNNSIDILNSDDTVVGSVDHKIKVAVGDISGFDQEFVDVLPETGKKGVIYFVPKEGGEDPDICDEYIWVGDRFELVGNTGVSINPIREIDLETWESMTDEQRKNGVYYVRGLSSGVTALAVNKRVDEINDNLKTIDIRCENADLATSIQTKIIEVYTNPVTHSFRLLNVTENGKSDLNFMVTMAKGGSHVTGTAIEITASTSPLRYSFFGKTGGASTVISPFKSGIEPLYISTINSNALTNKDTSKTINIPSGHNNFLLVASVSRHNETINLITGCNISKGNIYYQNKYSTYLVSLNDNPAHIFVNIYMFETDGNSDSVTLTFDSSQIARGSSYWGYQLIALD